VAGNWQRQEKTTQISGQMGEGEKEEDEAVEENEAEE
jgi:hypothetical protein